MASTALFDGYLPDTEPPSIVSPSGAALSSNSSPSLNASQKRPEPSVSGSESIDSNSLSHFLQNLPTTVSMASSSARNLRHGIGIDDQQRLQARSPRPQPSREHLQVMPEEDEEQQQQSQRQRGYDEDELTLASGEAGGMRSRSESAVPTPKPANAVLREVTPPVQSSKQPRQGSRTPSGALSSGRVR
jgi:hypothetical protein